MFRKLINRLYGRDPKLPKGATQWGRQHVVSPQRGTISAIVYRADGTVEDLGVIAEADIRGV